MAEKAPNPFTRLAELMIEHNIGVYTVRTIELKRLDSDYFED